MRQRPEDAVLLDDLLHGIRVRKSRLFNDFHGKVAGLRGGLDCCEHHLARASATDNPTELEVAGGQFLRD